MHHQSRHPNHQARGWMFTVLFPSDQQYLVMTSRWTPLSASPPGRSSHWYLPATAPLYSGALVSVVLGETCRCTATDLSATLSVHRICGISMCWFIWLAISPMALWCSSGPVSTTSSMWRRRIESSSDTGKKLTSVSFPSNYGGLPRPLRSLSSSASSGVEVIVSDFGFLVGAVGISMLLSPPAEAITVLTSVGLWRFWILLPSPVFLQVELSYAPPPGFQLDRDRNASISSSRDSNKEKFCASKNTLHSGNVRVF